MTLFVVLGGKMSPVKPRIICQDGVSLSVQVGKYRYCTPRQDEEPHSAVEVGYICDANDDMMLPPASWEQYAGGDFPTDIYGYVPVDLVEKFIAAHGGRTES